jgi:phosphate transport system substrate-binding protein
VTITRTSKVGGLLAATLILAACNGGGASSAPTAAATTPAATEGASAPAGVSASINVSGSSTVEPVTTAVAEAFAAQNADFKYTVEGPGTGDGFKRFCKGETDISDASRKIKQEEADACAAAGIQYVELKIAYDGMTVMTAPTNDAVTCLSFPDLYALIGPESTGFTKWSDAQALATELGSNTQFPAADLVITAPGEESGTYDSFVELVITPIATARSKDAAARADYQSSPNDNVIIEGIANNPTSLGWVGFAYAQENTDKIKELQVAKEANGTCVAPSQETISDGSYPLSRSLYLYVNKAKAAANAAVVAFVDYYLTDGTISTVLKTVPYVNLPQTELDASRSTWESSK